MPGSNILLRYLRIFTETKSTVAGNPSLMSGNIYSSEDMKHLMQLVEQPSLLGTHILEAAKSLFLVEDSIKDIDGEC